MPKEPNALATSSTAPAPPPLSPKAAPSRRAFLAAAVAAAPAAALAMPMLAGCETDDGSDGKTVAVKLPEYSYDGVIAPASIFAHGVASGDPLADRVILWTRVSDANAVADVAIEVFFEVALDPEFSDRVAAGTTSTSSARDYCVHVDAEGLKAATSYYYRFWLQGRSSPMGRTRTLSTGVSERARFGVCSCASYGAGTFVGYRKLAERADLEVVLHLGDYIYEYAGKEGSERFAPPTHVCRSLDDYRTRYSAHRLDLDLQEVHRQHAFICVWDDHESANNASSAGAPAHLVEDGAWSLRKTAAQQAWREWIPARVGDDGKIWRQFAFGDLVDLWMLDTRLWNRDKQTTPKEKAIIADPKRSILGPDQESWLVDGITSSPARWQIIGQQVMMGLLGIGASILNTDQWDGYEATRDRLFANIRKYAPGEVVVLTGDIHTSWANDLVEDSGDAAKYDPKTGIGALAVEFVVPGITSGGLPGGIGAGILDLVRENNPHVRWNDLAFRGYGVVDVTQDRVQCDWFHLEDIAKADSAEFAAASWQTHHGSGHLDVAAAPVAPRTDVAKKAP